MNKLEDYLEELGGELYIDGIRARDIADKFSTPCYVYSEKRIKDNFSRLKNAFDKTGIDFDLYYAIKANNNLSVVKVLKELGAGADTSCPNEIDIAKMVGFPDDKILYSGVYTSKEELKHGLEKGVKINLEDLSCVERLFSVGSTDFMSFRINPGKGKGGFEQLIFAGPDAKFGIIPRDVVYAYQLAKENGVKRFGMHMMTGSNVLDEDYFPAVTEMLLDLAGGVSKELGINFDFIDIGGGLGITYKPGEKDLDIDSTARKVAETFERKCDEHGLGRPKLVLEPGRYFVGDAGVLLTEVKSIKEGYKKFLGVDAGMNTLIRPMLYGAYHPIVNASNLDSKHYETVSIVGPICENTDQLAKDREFVKSKVGDLLCVLDAGAYGYGMGSNFNTRGRAAEVLVKNGESYLIRERETLNDLLRNQKMI